MSEAEKPKITRRRYLKYVGGAVVVAAVAGAGYYYATLPPPAPTPTPTPTTVASTTMAPVTTPAAESFAGIKLSYVTTSPCVTPDLDKAFMSKTGAEVDVTTVAWPDLHPRLVTALSAKAPEPNLFIYGGEWTYDFGSAGWLSYLEDSYTADEKAAMSPAAVAMYTYQGHLTGFVNIVMPSIMFVNQQLLSKAGFEPAKTWDEFVTQCTAMQTKGLVKYGITWPLQTGDDMSFDCFDFVNTSMGGRMFDDTGHPTFNDETGVKALQFIIDTLYKYKIANPLSKEVEKMGSLHPFLAGEEPYNWNWQFMYPITKDPKQSKIVDYSKYASSPQDPSATYSGFLAGGALSLNPFIPPGTQRDAAIAYGKFITSKDNALTNLKEKGWLSWWKDFYDDPAANAIEPGLPVLKAQLAKCTTREVIMSPATSRGLAYAEFSDIIRRNISKAWLQQTTAKAALDAAAAEAKAKITY